MSVDQLAPAAQPAAPPPPPPGDGRADRGGVVTAPADVAGWVHTWQPRTGAPPRGTVVVIP